MRFMMEYGYSVPVGMEEEHQRWLEANEQAVADACPEGVRYIGTFATVLSTEKGAGYYKTYLELDSYGAQDRLAAATKDAAADFGRLMRDVSRFFATEWDAPWSQGLYKAVVDATIFDPPTG